MPVQDREAPGSNPGPPTTILDSKLGSAVASEPDFGA